MATGRRPWANLDNEWAIMWNIAAGHPPQLPSPDQLSPTGIDFLTKSFETDPALRPSAAELLQHEWVHLYNLNLIEEIAADIFRRFSQSATKSSSHQLQPPIPRLRAAGNCEGFFLLSKFAEAVWGGGFFFHCSFLFKSWKQVIRSDHRPCMTTNFFGGFKISQWDRIVLH